MRVLFRGLAAGLASCVLLLVGCGDTGPTRYPVAGQVKVQSKPIEGAVVTFHPGDAAQSGPLFYAVTDADGRFRFRDSHAGDGVPEGAYRVTVVWQELRRDGDELLRSGRNLLPQRYSRSDASGLTAVVRPGPNELEPFELKSR